MKRHKTLIPLSRFHRKILMVALMLKRNAPPMKGYPGEILEKAAYIQDFYYQQLRHHFRLETDTLFRHIKGREDRMDDLIGELESQRRAIGKQVEELSKGGDLEMRLHSLGIALESHIRKEERQFFQAVQELLDEEEMTAIHTGMQQRLSRFNSHTGFNADREETVGL